MPLAHLLVPCGHCSGRVIERHLGDDLKQEVAVRDTRSVDGERAENQGAGLRATEAMELTYKEDSADMIRSRTIHSW